MVEVALADVAGTILLDAACDAAVNAHAPYSGFAVGAALLLSDGAIMSAANLENASYGLSLCAEAAALATANSSGRLADIVAIGIVGGRIGADGITGTAPVRPCGRCRQMLVEASRLAGREIIVHCGSADRATQERFTLTELMPHAFGAELNAHRSLGDT